MEITDKKLAKLEKDFDTVYDIIIDRLDKTGPIKTTEAVHMVHKLPYARVCTAFHKIMGLMVEQNKASKVRNGTWMILKPNRRQVNV